MSRSGIRCCYKCTDRWVSTTDTCHSTCERYISARAKLDKHNEEIRKQKQKEFDAALVSKKK